MPLNSDIALYSMRSLQATGSVHSKYLWVAVKPVLLVFNYMKSFVAFDTEPGESNEKNMYSSKRDTI